MEVRINHVTTPAILAKRLDLDKSYASRTINKLVVRGILVKSPSPDDSRSVSLSLTAYGQVVFDDINQRSNQQIQGLLAGLNAGEQ